MFSQATFFMAAMEKLLLYFFSSRGKITEGNIKSTRNGRKPMEKTISLFLILTLLTGALAVSALADGKTFGTLSVLQRTVSEALKSKYEQINAL